MAVDQISSVSQQEELLTLPKSMLLIILSEQKKLSMDDVCKTILRWVEADQEARRTQLLELLPFVCFPQLSLGYLCDLVTYLNHPFSKILFENVHEGLNYNIKGQQTQDVTLRRKILARQPVLLNLPEVQPRVVMFGGYTEVSKSIRDTYVFDLNNRFMKRYSLAPMPEDVGLDFASCKWYNEVYVSGGSQLPTFFAVYKPGDNKWEVLPSLPDDGREKHAMAAISCNIYVLGGFKKDSDGKNTISFSVMRYNTSSREWSIFCQLPSGVQEAAAAVLGHRIYLFGGVDSKGRHLSLVQCVDTLSSCAYQAGKLPSPTCGARALSNGGRIYVVRPKGDVLCMWESFPLAEQIEKRMSEEKEKGKDQSSYTSGSTVSFREVGKFPERRHFSACLRSGEITVCGGENESGEILDSFVKIPLEGGDISNKSLTLITKAAKFDLHEINIPVIYLKEETSVVQPFRVGDKVILDREENQRRIRQSSFMQHTAQPQGTGVITAIEATMITVDFAPYFYGWRGQAHQLQHA
ncbi:kelch-like protein 24 [Pomacea canaliculata]|uniref:kelch-like protein 24 n=1 Tax=Pomacea canaliculata TaxID=400727 RepID=UPI000D73D7C4|nr:kelch-like protein 24 [Pomacea canaliculata]